MDMTVAMRAFVRTVERGSLTAAARDLGISQPAVSKMLRNLEREVQSRLLERNSRSLRPTPQGLRLYQDISGALSTLDAAVEAVRGDAGTLNGSLRLHAPVCLGESHVHRIVSAFQDRHPDVSITLMLENRLSDLIHENIDLAFTVGQPRTEATVCRRVGTIRRLLVATPSYMACRGSITDPLDLMSHAILSTDVALDRKGGLSLRQADKVVELPLRPVLVTNNARVLMEAIMAGRGVGTAQTHMVDEALEEGRLVRILPNHELESSELFLAYPSAKYLRPAVRKFIDFAAAEIGEIAGLRHASA